MGGRTVDASGAVLLKQSAGAADARRSMRVGSRTPGHRLAAAVCVALATALAAAGCGSSTVAAGPLVRAADVTSEAGGAQMAMRIEATGGTGPSFTMTGSGGFNFKTFEAQMSLDMGGLPASPATPSGSLHMTELMKLPNVYITSDAFAGKLPGGAQWMQLNLDRVVGEGLGISLQGAAGQANPAEYLDYLRGTGASVTVVGQEPVRGVPTTHYHATIDFAKAAERVPATNRARLKATFERLRSMTGSAGIPVDAWVDSAHRVRRIVLDYPVNVGGQHAHAGFTIEYFDFGSTPSVTVPPANDVYDATQVLLEHSSSAGSTE